MILRFKASVNREDGNGYKECIVKAKVSDEDGSIFIEKADIDMKIRQFTHQCDSAGALPKGNPPAYNCINCNSFWFVNFDIPICSKPKL